MQISTKPSWWLNYQCRWPILDICIWAIGNWIIACEYRSYPMLSRHGLHWINTLIVKEHWAIESIECPLYELAIHFTSDYDGLIWAGMLSACGSEWWLDTDHFRSSWVCITMHIIIIITSRSITNAHMHTPGFVLVTDITVTIIAMMAVPAVNTYMLKLICDCTSIWEKLVHLAAQ